MGSNLHYIGGQKVKKVLSVIDAIWWKIQRFSYSPPPVPRFDTPEIVNCRSTYVYNSHVVFQGLKNIYSTFEVKRDEKVPSIPGANSRGNSTFLIIGSNLNYIIGQPSFGNWSPHPHPHHGKCELIGQITPTIDTVKKISQFDEKFNVLRFVPSPRPPVLYPRNCEIVGQIVSIIKNRKSALYSMRNLRGHLTFWMIGSNVQYIIRQVSPSPVLVIDHPHSHPHHRKCELIGQIAHTIDTVKKISQFDEKFNVTIWWKIQRFEVCPPATRFHTPEIVILSVKLCL